jgi:prepilin-type N-terminal cleavage/methylation domain-containing protein
MVIKRAFTLIELLVVVSIIALLIAILLPALSKAREYGLEMTCTNNVRSFSQAMFAYQADVGTLPRAAEGWEGAQNRYGGHNWYQTLMGTGEQGAIGTGYMGDNVNLETQRCPITMRNLPGFVTNDSGHSDTEENRVYTYKYNEKIGGLRESIYNGTTTQDLKPYSSDAIRDASSTVLLGEALQPWSYNTSLFATNSSRAQAPLFRTAREVGIPHAKGDIAGSFNIGSVTVSARVGTGTIAYVDGSVQQERGTQSSRWMSQRQNDPLNSYERAYADPDDMVFEPFWQR